MKKLNLILAVAAGACFFAACGGNKTGSSVDSSSTTKTVTTTVDSLTATANPDTAFTNKAAMGGMAEVALAKLALTKTKNAKIISFANMMVADHGQANTELAGIAKTKNITLPADVGAKHQAKMDSLSNLSGADFNHAYVDAMVDGHVKTLALLKDEAAYGKDPELKAFAAKLVPTVQMHLDAINKIAAGMK